MDPLSLLQNWYLSQCDSDWEHHYGVRIDTLDNPGWTLKIDLTGTEAEDRLLDRVKIQRTDNDWIFYRVEDKQFTAAAGPQNLKEAIEIFLDWVNHPG